MNDKYKKYADLSKKIKELEAEKDKLKEDLLVDLGARGNTLKADFGTFSLVERKMYKYSAEVKAKDIELKTLKKKEEESGIAEATISKSLRFQ